MIHIKNNIFKLAGLVTACAVISACDSGFDNPVGDKSFSNGDADFTKFVSVGDSLTAGYADGALYLAGQNNSYPAILAQQFAKVGGGSFSQPLVSDNLGGLLFNGNTDSEFPNRLVLDAESQSPEPIAGAPTTEVFSLQTGEFNNTGVAGAKSFHLTLGDYGDPAGLAVTPATANPYYVRFAPSATTSIISAAAGQAASFFVMWIGNNDVLSYATSGGIGYDQTGNLDPSSYTPNDITDPTVFAGVYNGLVGAMTTNPATQGVLISIPDVSTIPFFTTVPFNAVPLDQATVDLLNGSYAAYNTGVTASIGVNGLTAEEAEQRQIVFSVGQNAVVILDEDLTNLTGVNAALINMRQATADDLLVLTASTKIGTLADPNNPNSAWGVGVPLEDGDVLIPSEIAAIDTARLAFNVAIKAAADANPNLVFFDAAALMAQINDGGFNYGTGFIDSTYATGGAFSLDGVHPTARGYAVVANQIIDVINSEFNATVPAVDPGSYTTIFVK